MSAPALVRHTGQLRDLAADAYRDLMNRGQEVDASITARTTAIVERVRVGGDTALRDLASELDGVTIGALEVPRALWRAALQDLDPALRKALERASANIGRVHQAFLPESLEVESEPGIIIGRRPDPLARVGVYAPGGRAAYPSSVLMGAIPARVAGVEEVIVCSPPDATGVPSQVVLAAAELADVNQVFAIGGAGAVAAMAFGTATVPKVDRIVGPGNAYVAEAKLQLSRTVAFDSPAGPSELLVIADASADPTAIAREMAAQAEHDPMACVVTVLIAPAEPERLLHLLHAAVTRELRSPVIAEALGSRGGVLVADSLAEAIAFASAYAPEHLLLAITEPDAALPLVRNAGTVFVGETASVAFGDYITGANHVLPTGGRARSYSGLSTVDFIRWTTYQRISPEAAASLSIDTGLMASAEGLHAHATAARAWAGQ